MHAARHESACVPESVLTLPKMCEDAPLEPPFSSSSETEVSLKCGEHRFKEKAPSPGSQEWLPAAGIAWSRVPQALRSGCPLLGSCGREFSFSVQERGQQSGQKSPPLQPGDEPG